MTQPDTSLLLHCSACQRDKPRGWFARAGVDAHGRPMRASHCRECRKPEKALGAAKRRGAGVKPLPRRLIVILWQRQRGACSICGRSMVWGEFEVEHKTAIARGGKHEMSNLGLAHGSCNRLKGSKILNQKL